MLEGMTDAGKSVRLVASSEHSLTGSQKAALKRGEIAVSGEGHAEITAYKAAERMGIKPIRIARSRAMCEGCALTSANLGVWVAGKLTKKARQSLARLQRLR